MAVAPKRTHEQVKQLTKCHRDKKGQSFLHREEKKGRKEEEETCSTENPQVNSQAHLGSCGQVWMVVYRKMPSSFVGSRSQQMSL